VPTAHICGSSHERATLLAKNSQEHTEFFVSLLFSVCFPLVHFYAGLLLAENLPFWPGYLRAGVRMSQPEPLLEMGA